MNDVANMLKYREEMRDWSYRRAMQKTESPVSLNKDAPLLKLLTSFSRYASAVTNCSSHVSQVQGI